MPKFKNKTIVVINSFPITIEKYDSKIIIKDDNENKVKISKDNNISILLNLEGNFQSGKDITK
jgi:hypothetical protein